jgi:hypothetical protein
MRGFLLNEDANRCARWLVGFTLPLIASLGFTASAATNLIPSGAAWRYWSAAVDPDLTWKGTNFDDTAWAEGIAQFGYGDGDEATVIWNDPVAPPITAYFRCSFFVANPRDFFGLTLRVLSDDGAVVYLNGTEVYRNNLPAGPITSSTLALNPVQDGNESVFKQFWASPYWLVAGTNILAVELHQNTNDLPDASFDLTLVGNLPLTPPTVSITSPTNGSVFDITAISITTAVSDLDGYIYLVDFFTNGVFLGRSMAPPFNLIWNASQPGRYALTARAVDNSGRSAFSAPVHIQIGAVAADRIVRGPYLQSGSPTGLVVRWHTDWFTASIVRYGTSPLLDAQAGSADLTIEHEVQLTGLFSDKKYFYSVGTSENTIAGGLEYFFVTAPTNNKPTRVWVIGDSGTANSNAAAVRDAYADMTDRTDVWLMLGDNAYEEGTDQQYQNAVFEMYPNLLRQTVVWPTLGNHDAASVGLQNQFPFLDIFTLPRNGEGGGLPSGTEKYYSFDYANIHFICLDSASSLRTPGSPMLEWLENDLAATTKDWIIAYWHHPPYSWGTHNSDYEFELIEMRRYVLPILENHGVDLVLSGHSHNYERSFLLSGHYGTSSEIDPSMVLNAGAGRMNQDGAYEKPAGGLGARQGTVYAVCGCSGEGGTFEFLKHPAMFVNYSGHGSMVLDIDGLRLDARFLRSAGALTITSRSSKACLRAACGQLCKSPALAPTKKSKSHGPPHSCLSSSRARTR